MHKSKKFKNYHEQAANSITLLGKVNYIFSNINFDECQITSADLSNCIFYKCSFRNSNLSNVNLFNCQVISCVAEGVYMGDSTLLCRKY